MSSVERWREYVARRMLLILLQDKGMLNTDDFLCCVKKLENKYKDVLFADDV